MKSWKGWFQPHILERGRTYFDEGRVLELEQTEDGYTATVDGTEEYEVEILLDGDSIEDMLCDCPYAEDGNYCKHMAAVLFAVNAGEPSKKKTPPKEERLTPDSLVRKIPDDQLRPLLTELVWARSCSSALLADSPAPGGGGWGVGADNHRASGPPMISSLGHCFSDMEKRSWMNA